MIARQGAAAIRRLEYLVEPWAKEFVEPTVNGDAEAALALCNRAGNNTRGALSVALFATGIPNAAYRTFLGAAWDHDHGFVMAHAKTRRILERMFLYASFALPKLSDVITVWRGTAGASPAGAARGMSWSLDRDVACFFAMRAKVGKELVLKCVVPRSSVVYYSNERREQEVLFFRGRRETCVDGTPDDWTEGFERFQKSKKADIQAHQEKMRSGPLFG